MIAIRRSEQRGKAEFDWLKSHHTFSFGNYYDPQQMGFSALRVINDDEVIPGAGFPTHGHRDMEIISYVLQGEIAHRDSEGNVATLPAGEFQLMSAGSGITHSEYNASATEPLKFLQIWIQPNAYGINPGYQQKDFGREEGLTLIASPTGESGSLTLRQDAKLYQLRLAEAGTINIPATSTRRYYLHIIAGKLTLNSETLAPGDGGKLEDMNTLELTALDDEVLALVFDLP